MNNNFFKVSFPIILLGIAMFYITAQFIQPAPKKEIIIATGGINGAYYKTALIYKALLEKDKIKVTLLKSAGSIENIALLKDKKADFAFVQNGILDNTSNLDFLANVYYEPLWVFYKNDKYKMDYLIQLISKKISTGKEGSGSKYLSQIILNDNGLNSNNSTILSYDNMKAKELLIKGEIDAMFIVASHKSKIVKELLENPKVNVLNVKRAKAYSQKYSYLDALDLYEGTIDLYKNLPDENIKLLSTTATLVARKDVPEELTRLFLKKLNQVHNKKSLFSEDNEFPNLKNTKMNINEEAKKYFKNGDSFLETVFPYWIASNIDRLKILIIPLLTLMIPLFKGVFPLYTWTMRSKIYRWYEILNTIDKKVSYLKKEDLDLEYKTLENLKIEIQEDTKVPLSFMGEYYNLIMHIDLIQNRIINLKNNIL